METYGPYHSRMQAISIIAWLIFRECLTEIGSESSL